MSAGFSLVTLKSGLKSLRSLDHCETFHPTSGPLEEAHVLHVNQQKLIERIEKVIFAESVERSRKFVIWDVGFGAAANIIAVINSFRNNYSGARALGNYLGHVEIHSFDKTIAPIEFALSSLKELDYLAPYELELRTLIRDCVVQLKEGTVWQLHLGDFSGHVRNDRDLPHAPDAILYDPYSAATNPEMWTLEHFTHLWKCLDPNQPCMWTNYTRSTAVRTSLLLAGFFVGTGCIIGDKSETTVASNRLELLDRPLNRNWLERVKNSTNAAPLKSATYSKSYISREDFERLQAHSQFRLPIQAIPV